MVTRLSSPVQVGFDYEGFLRHVHPSPYRLVELMRKNPTDQQRAVLDLVEYEHKIPLSGRKKRYTVRSGQGTGKTTMLGWIGAWRTLRRVNGLTVHTAPTGRQCRDAYLADLRVGVQRGDPILAEIFEFRFDRILMFGQTEWAIKTMTAANDINLQGQHRDNLTASIDEGSGVGKAVFEQFQGTLSNSDSMMFVAGNPNLRECYFYETFYGEHRKLWHRFKFDAEKSSIAATHRNELIAQEYGRDSDVYRIRVLGEFPRGNPDAIILPETLEQSMQRHEHAQLAHLTPLKGYPFPCQIGIDFAWMGDHESVIALRVNRKVYIYPFHHIDPQDLILEAIKIQQQHGIDDDQIQYVGDASTFGGPAMRKLREKYGKNTYEFHNGANPAEDDYKNQVTEGWFHLRWLLKTGQILLPNDSKLRSQMLARTFEVESKSGKVTVTDKNKHLRGESPSPDRAEAVLYSCYNRGVTRSMVGLFSNPLKDASHLFVPAHLKNNAA